MKDPQRLLEASGSELELRLLRAGAAEQPAAGAIQRLADKLGEGGATPPSPPSAAFKLGLLPIGLVAAGLTLASALWMAAPTPPPAAGDPSGHPAHAPTPRSSHATGSPASQATSSPASQATSSPASQATSSPAPHATGTAALQAADDRSPSAPRSLAQEIARIDAIRGLLASDQTKSALGALQDYQRDFPSGALRQEADVLSIDAQRRAGDRGRARALAARFLAEHPESPHSARVRELLSTLGADAR